MLKDELSEKTKLCSEAKKQKDAYQSKRNDNFEQHFFKSIYTRGIQSNCFQSLPIEKFRIDDIYTIRDLSMMYFKQKKMVAQEGEAKDKDVVSFQFKVADFGNCLY